MGSERQECQHPHQKAGVGQMKRNRNGSIQRLIMLHKPEQHERRPNATFNKDAHHGQDRKLPDGVPPGRNLEAHPCEPKDHEEAQA